MQYNRAVACFTLLLLWVCAHVRADTPRAEVVADLLAEFPRARVRDSSSCSVLRPAVAGGVRQPGLMEHPMAGGKPARLEYRLILPRLSGRERLLLAFDYGISDGARFDDSKNPSDGVRYLVEVDGRRLFEGASRESRWQHGAVDLTPFAGRQVVLSLLTDALQTPAYDWALWGRPRVLRFRGTGLKKSGGVADALVGALALRLRPGREARVRVSPIGGDGAPLEWRVMGAPSPADGLWTARDFAFPRAKRVRVDVQPGDAVMPGQIWLAAYAPKPQLALVSATSAVVLVGRPAVLRVVVRNDSPGMLRPGEAVVRVQADGRTLAPRSLPSVGPGETWQGEWPWRPSRPGTARVTARLTARDGGGVLRSAVTVFSPPGSRDVITLSGRNVRMQFVRSGSGFAYARILGPVKGAWRPLAVWRPLLRAVLPGSSGDIEWDIRPDRATRSPSGREGVFSGRLVDPQGVAWEVRLRVELEPDRPFARLRCEWQPQASRRIHALWGPNLYVGDGNWGEAKTWGLFPGLEYLYKGERSSSPRDFAMPLHDRRTPVPWKITMPLMAISVGEDSQAPPAKAARFYCPDSLKDMRPTEGLRPDPEPITVALLWNHEQKWDGVRRYPSARFVSPNADEGMRNHRMGLFLPSVPDFVPENADRAKTSYRIPAGKRLALEASVLVTPGHPLAAVREWYRDTGGIPAPGPWPRGYEEAVALCRTGFLQTVWNDRTNRWRHCIEFPESHAPGFAALLWMDAHLAPGTEGGRLSAERVDRVAKVMLEDAGPPVFTSMAACHIMRWEFPFLYGCLPEALPGIEPMVNERIRSQGAEGGWRFHTDDAQRADLGQRGDTVSGYNAHNAWILARYGRVTGDRRAIEAAEKALRFIERFRVPRGAGPWECPIYEPDVLAATWLLAACLEGFRATGNPRYLYDAVYWAESSLPFVYPWQLPDRPMMLGASLPVFGSTFYTHSWLGMPVQWEGLTLAYHLRHLADDLERARPRADGSPLRPLVGLSPADWRRMADLLTVSGLHQQVESGERVGTYPDSITDFQKRNPVFINPENILVNLFAMRGHDPDIKTARARRGEREITVSSGAAVEALVADGNGVRFRLKFFPGENSHTLIAGCEPTTVQVNGLPLPRSASPVRREPGWWWDRARQRAYLVILHATEEVSVELAAR